MYILLAGLNHRTAPVEIREKFAVCGSDLQQAYEFLTGCEVIEGAVVLATCNRTEIYAAARNKSQAMSVLLEYLHKYSQIDKDALYQYIYQYDCDNAILHLFRVASGLDSMLLGESQIISQVKEAYGMAVQFKATNNVLNTLFHKSMFVGKRVRTETEISCHPVSVSHAAVDLAVQELTDLADKNILIIGAGEMSEITVRCLKQHGAGLVIVSNRSYNRAVEMAGLYGGKAVGFESLEQELRYADLVISCTAANHYVLRRDRCEAILKSRAGKKIILIDIAVPRDIEPAISSIDGVLLYDIDKLQGVVDTNYLERKRAANQAELIIKEEVIKLNEWLGTLFVVPVITALKARGEEIKNNELQKAFNRLDKLSEREKNVLSIMANSIVNQLLHNPIVNLKEMATDNQGHLFAEITKKLFVLPIDELRERNYYDHAEDRH